MNCLEWLPILFVGISEGSERSAVPLNSRYAPDEIRDTASNKADADVLVFGPEFIGRVEEIADEIRF